VPRLATLMTLAYDAARERVVFGDGAGSLHAHELARGADRHRRAHDGEVVAVSWHPEADIILSAGAQDGRAVLSDPDTLEPRSSEASFPRCFGLIPLPGARWVAVEEAGRLSVWGLQGEQLQQQASAPAPPVRCWVGPDVASHVARTRLANEQRRTELVTRCAEARGRGDFESARAAARELAELGYGPWALVEEAAVCRAESLLLEECRLWQQLDRAWVGPEPMPPALGYLRAENYEKLLLPEEAAEAFEALGPYRDAAARASALREHPLVAAGDPCAPHQIVRGDLQAGHHVLEEIDKHSLLGRRFEQTVVIRAVSPKPIKESPSLGALERALADAGGPVAAGLCSAVTEESRRLYVDGRDRELRWLRLDGPADDPLSRWLSFALEIYASPRGPQRIAYALFRPAVAGAEAGGAALSPDEWNRRVADAWCHVFHAAEAKEWVAGLHKRVGAELNRLVNELHARRSRSS
jgi:hypothetical protein